MKGYMRIINTDGSGSTRELDKPPELDELRDAVGGWIELVPYFQCVVEGPDQERIDECIVYCNEEGKIRNMAHNAKASRMWRDAQLRKFGTSLSDTLMGPIVILWGDKTFMLTM